MAEYIEREAAEDAVGEAHLKGLNPLLELRDVPTADVAPVVHGKWKPTTSPYMNECEECSVCGYQTLWWHRFNYCPQCGAKMNGGAIDG